MLRPQPQTQRTRLSYFDVPESVDVHCHCLPGMDDGPETMAEAIELCRLLARDGVTTVIATPHQLGRYEGANLAGAVRAACGRLQDELSRLKIALSVRPGADVRIDERIMGLLKLDEILTLGDGGLHLLLELPHETFIDPRPLIRLLAAGGLQPIISHPERHRFVRAHMDRIAEWIELGAVCQVTAGSLVGDFGPDAESAAWRLIGAGFAQVVASDAHDRTRRPPRMTDATAAIERRLGYPTARRVCIENPLRILQVRRCEDHRSAGFAKVV